jgi:hypothetical protein
MLLVVLPRGRRSCFGENMDSIGWGLDLSHHQDPKKVPWERIKAAADFVICRAAYGGVLLDRQVVEHVRRTREIGVKVGLYQFFRPGQSVDVHFNTMKLVSDAVDLGDGDILPVLDIEADGVAPHLTPPSPEWEPNLHELVERMRQEWGGVMLYLTQRDWRLLGKPLWMLDHPLWCAHYTSNADPATPAGRKPHIWQYRVGPLDPEGPGGYDKKAPEYDHNRLIQPLPLIGESREIDPISDEERAHAMGLVALNLDEEIHGMDRDSRRCA